MRLAMDLHVCVCVCVCVHHDRLSGERMTGESHHQAQCPTLRLCFSNALSAAGNSVCCRWISNFVCLVIWNLREALPLETSSSTSKASVLTELLFVADAKPRLIPAIAFFRELLESGV